MEPLSDSLAGWRPLVRAWDSDGRPVPLTRRQLHRWDLVLQARQIPCRSLACERGWLLLVPVTHYRRAREELRLYEEENRDWPPPLPDQTALNDNLLPTLSVLVLLASFHNLTQLSFVFAGHQPVDWLTLGSADSGRILHGEWWRLVTALTLHADWLHLLGNLAFGGLFVIRLCRDLGSGLGWSLILLGGVLGNLANALLQQQDHRAIGASTAVFAAVGLLAAISLVRYRFNLRKRWPLPVAGGLALLALLGSSGENTDLGAHLFGFGCGLLLGLICENLLQRFGRLARRLDRLLAAGCIALVLGAWWAALRGGV